MQRFKWTTPIHVLGGIILSATYPWMGALNIALFIGFGVFEFWEDEREIKEEKKRGHTDFWEMLLGCFLGIPLCISLKGGLLCLT